MNTFTSTGIIRYDNSNKAFRLTVEVDQELSNYYYSLIPKYYKANRPRWPAHVTVVRPEKEIPPTIRYWEDHEGERIPFLYDPEIQFGRDYFWLNIWCKRLEDIRRELGLPVISLYTMPPTGFAKCFHCTIGNVKQM